MVEAQPVRVVVFGRAFPLPRRRWQRQTLGWGFIGGGFLSPLPVFGPWMFPVGLWILSVDSRAARRMRRRLTIKIGRKYPRINAWLKPPPQAGRTT